MVARARDEMDPAMKTALDGQYAGFNAPDAALDPVQIVRRYADVRDREIVAFIAAGLAFGRVASIMASIEDALRDPHFIERGVFAAKLTAGSRKMTALPVPIAPEFRAQGGDAGYPALGEGNDELL